MMNTRAEAAEREIEDLRASLKETTGELDALRAATSTTVWVAIVYDGPSSLYGGVFWTAAAAMRSVEQNYPEQSPRAWERRVEADGEVSWQCSDTSVIQDTIES